MKVNYLNFISQWEEEEKFLIPIIKKVMSSGQYVGVKAEEITKFENKVKKMCGVKHAVALNSGTDALILAMHSMGIKRGDEVITPSNSYVASTGAIIHLGAIPVFVDVLPDQNIDPKKIEAAITNKTRAIMPVHLTGRSCSMDEIMKISKRVGKYLSKIHLKFNLKGQFIQELNMDNIYVNPNPLEDNN